MAVAVRSGQVRPTRDSLLTLRMLRSGRRDADYELMPRVRFARPVPHDFKQAAASLGTVARRRHAPSTAHRTHGSGLDAGNDVGPGVDDSHRASKKPRGRFGFGVAATSPPTARASSSSSPSPKSGEVLKLFRVNMRELKRKDDYQVSPGYGFVSVFAFPPSFTFDAQRIWPGASRRRRNLPRCRQLAKQLALWAVVTLHRSGRGALIA